MPTIIFVHGNQITPGDAKNEGLEVYRRMIMHGCDAPRIRFVIFSWPSSKVRRTAERRSRESRANRAGRLALGLAVGSDAAGDADFARRF